MEENSGGCPPESARVADAGPAADISVRQTNLFRPGWRTQGQPRT